MRSRAYIGGVAAALEADNRVHRALLARDGHLLRLLEVGAQGPLAEHGLAGVQARHDEVVVPGHAHGDGDEVDVRVSRHVVDVVEGQLSAELLLRGLRGLLAGGTDGLELVIRERFERGDVGVGAPAAAALGHGRADDADADLVRHLNLPVFPVWWIH